MHAGCCVAKRGYPWADRIGSLRALHDELHTVKTSASCLPKCNCAAPILKSLTREQTLLQDTTPDLPAILDTSCACIKRDITICTAQKELSSSLVRVSNEADRF